MYEPSDALYRSHWFCVKKKSGTLRIVHNLQPLNAVTIRNAGLPPDPKQIIKSMASRSCYTILDLFVGYDHQTLDKALRDLTTVSTPVGTQQLTCMPQGWTGTVVIFHGDIVFILEPEILDPAKPFLDDTNIKGPKCYDLPLKFSFPSSSSATLPPFAVPWSNPKPSLSIIFPSALPNLSLLQPAQPPIQPPDQPLDMSSHQSYLLCHGLPSSYLIFSFLFLVLNFGPFSPCLPNLPIDCSCVF